MAQATHGTEWDAKVSNETTDGRAEWERPALRRLVTSEAQTSSGMTADGGSMAGS
jgi:hypothetical protein